MWYCVKDESEVCLALTNQSTWAIINTNACAYLENNCSGHFELSRPQRPYDERRTVSTWSVGHGDIKIMLIMTKTITQMAMKIKTMATTTTTMITIAVTVKKIKLLKTAYLLGIYSLMSMPQDPLMITQHFSRNYFVPSRHNLRQYKKTDLSRRMASLTILGWFFLFINKWFRFEHDFVGSINSFFYNS